MSSLVKITGGVAEFDLRWRALSAASTIDSGGFADSWDRAGTPRARTNKVRLSDNAQDAAGICRSESSEEMMRAFTVITFAEGILHLSKVRAQSLHHGSSGSYADPDSCTRKPHGWAPGEI